MPSLRIELEESNGRVRCRLSGWLDREGVVEARRQLESACRPAALDAGALVFADESGLELLAELRRAGCATEGLRPYLELRLEQLEQRWGATESQQAEEEPPGV